MKQPVFKGDDMALRSCVETQIWYLTDPETYGLANEAHAEFVGLRKEDLAYKPLLARNSAEAKMCVDGNHAVFTSKQTFRTEEWVTNAHGERRLLDITKTPLLDLDGNVDTVVCCANDITERVRDECSLLDSQGLVLGFVESIPDVVAIQRPDHTIERFNEAGYQMLERRPEEVIGKKCYELIGRDHECEECATRLALQKKKLACLEKYVPEMGLFLECRSKPILDEDGHVVRVIEQIRDITERKTMENALRESEERFQSVLDVIPDLISIHTPAMDIVYSNWNGFGAVAAEKRVVETKCYKTYRDRDAICPDCRATEVLQTKEPFKGEIELPDGRWVDLRVIPLKDQNDNVKLIVDWVRDITERKQAEKEAAFLSYHDGLTELYNRRFFDEELQRLDVSRNLPLTLVMLDVNGLKLTNDAFGHRVGDELLIKVKDALRNVCRADDILARIGGDEFAIVLPRTDESQADQLMKRIQRSVAGETVENLPISVSCGCGTKVDPQESITAVFKTAEDRMYQHKTSERSSYRHHAIDLIVQTLYTRSPREQQHAERVGRLCGEMGAKMGLDAKELTTAGILHDIGKVAAGNSSLDTGGPLSDSEWKEMKRHPEAGYNILSTVSSYGPLAECVLTHHERWDGAGYPKGLKGEAIPLTARIIAVANAYDAMTNDRAFRQGVCHEEAMAEIEACAGTQFDPEVVRVFSRMLTERDAVGKQE